MSNKNSQKPFKNLLEEQQPEEDDEQENKKKQKMSLPDKLLLDPIEKYEQFDRFPWKLIVHIVLIVATTALIVLLIQESATYRRTTDILWSKLFLVDDGNYEDMDPQKKVFLYNAQDVKYFIGNSTQNYYNVNNSTLDRYEDPTDSIKYGPLEYQLTKDDIGPFGDTDTFKNFIYEIAKIQISFNIRSYVPPEGITNYDCFKWNIVQTLSFQDRGYIEATLVVETDECGSSIQLGWRSYIWLHIIVIIFAIWSLLLSIRYIYKFQIMFKQIKRRYRRTRKRKDQEYEDSIKRINLRNQKTRWKMNSRKSVNKKRDTFRKSNTTSNIQNNQLLQRKKTNEDVGSVFSSMASPKNSKISLQRQTSNLSSTSITKLDQDKEELKDERIIKWQDLNFLDKLSLFNLWTIVAILGSFFQILSSFIAITQLDLHLIDYQSLCGVGCMLAWINITRYIEYSRQSAVFINTFSRSLPYVLRFLVGVFPLFMGYVFLGIALFWNSKRFSSPSGAMVTLFAVMNGDMVYDTFHDLQIINIVLAQLYLYTFVMLFINVVQNVFITIVEDGFISVKYRDNHHHILHQPDRGQVDFRQVQEDKQKAGDISIGATGEYHGQTGDSKLESTPFIFSGGVNKELERVHPKMLKQLQKKQQEYKSKMALHRIMQGGSPKKRREQNWAISPKNSMFSQSDEDENFVQWKRNSRLKNLSGQNKEDEKSDINAEMMNQQIRKFGLSTKQKIQTMIKYVKDNTSSLDDQIIENFKKQLREIKKKAQEAEDSV